MVAVHVKLPKVDGAVVFRGAGSEESIFASNLTNGQEFHFNGRFTSSSNDEYVADLFRQGNGGNVIWQIESKTGVDIKKINSGESEVLFKPFTIYKLLDVSASTSNSQVLIYSVKEL
jgi:carbon monoxide dehydrogenase subunit G